MSRILIVLFGLFCAQMQAQPLYRTPLDERKPETTSIESWRIPERQPQSARLIFVGDLMQHLPQVHAARRASGFDYTPVFAEVAPLFAEADLVVANLETTLTRTAHYTGYPCFRSPVALAQALFDVGVDVAVLANNHCCDNGAVGIKTTAEELDQRGVQRTGVFVDSLDYARHNLLQINIGALRMAMLNYTYGTNGMPVPKGMIVHHIDTLHIAADLARIDRQAVDFVAVYLHWGIEYQRTENREQQRLADFLQRHGVDLIIGSHPHVVQPAWCDGQHVVVYSLGNFVSNQQQPYTDQGLIAAITAVKQSDGAMRFRLEQIPTRVRRSDYRVRLEQHPDSTYKRSE